MINRYLRFSTALVVAIPALVLAFQNCGNNPQFAATALESMESPKEQPSSSVLKTVKVKIGTSQQQAEVDIVWVVDNSASMSEEANHVRRNVASFADRVRQKANLRMALISRKGTSGTYVSLPEDPDFLQIDQEVTSWNPLLLAGSALCGAGDQASKTCLEIDNESGMNKLSSFQNIKNEIEDSKKIRGSLRDFLSRKSSKKVFVFVTDDDSSWHQSRFLEVAKENLDGQTPMVSAFARLSLLQSPCGQRNGSAYMDLAKKTSGSTYNICASDWTSTFAQLANDVERVIERVIDLPKGVKAQDVVALTRGNKQIDPQFYQVTDSTIRLSQSLNISAGEVIQIVYQTVE